jgi:serine/threonine-protein kinase HipA
VEKHVFVYVDLQAHPLGGTAVGTHAEEQESATFEYDKVSVAHVDRFALEPALKLGPGPFHTSSEKPCSAPSATRPGPLGRVLMRRAERRRAGQARPERATLWEIDYLLMVDDEARQGAAIRRAGRGRFSPNTLPTIPPLIRLPRLLSAAEHVAPTPAR